MVRRFEPGEAVALREVWRGRVWSARPVTIVQDSDEEVRLFIPAGARWFAPFESGRRLKIPQPRFELLEQRYEKGHVLSFAWQDTFAAVLLLFGSDWSASHWYVNLEDPLRRSEVGFDTLDHKLDLILELDGSWRWKDEEEFAEAIRRGQIPEEDAPVLRADAELAARRIVEGDPPFDRDWTSWRPDASWPVPVLPDGWDRI
jgi:hypothetical protein